MTTRNQPATRGFNSFREEERSLKLSANIHERSKIFGLAELQRGFRADPHR